MAKFHPSAAYIKIGANTYYMNNIVTTEDAEQVDVTDGGTSGNGRETITARVARTVAGDLFIQDGTAEPAVGLTGTVDIVAKTGTTNKGYAYTNGEVLSKGLTLNAAGTEGAVASYNISLDGDPTLTQFT